MRVYRLHDASWTRIVTHRVRRPNVVKARLQSRRRRDQAVPLDGQLVLIAGNQAVDPRNGNVVSRRELLDRLVEALSAPGIDGVVASADLLEELTLLNVLEHRLAICSGPGEQQGVAGATIVAANFDGAHIATSGSGGSHGSVIADQVAELQAAGVPALIDLVQSNDDDRSEFDTEWRDWIEPFQSASRVVSTGAGVWFTLPSIVGMSSLAAQTAFPVLVRDTDVPIDASAWATLFSGELPLNVRGMVIGASGLFPITESVGDATEAIAESIRQRVR